MILYGIDNIRDLFGHKVNIPVEIFSTLNLCAEHCIGIKVVRDICISFFAILILFGFS